VPRHHLAGGSADPVTNVQLSVVQYSVDRNGGPKLLIHQLLYLIVAPLMLAVLLPRLPKRTLTQCIVIASLPLAVGVATWIWELGPLGGRPALGNSWLGYGIILAAPFLLVSLTWFLLVHSPLELNTMVRRAVAGLAILLAYGLGVILGLSVALSFGLANP
jgi:hypothetical protein